MYERNFTFYYTLLLYLLRFLTWNRGGLKRIMTTLIFQFLTFFIHFSKWEFIFMIFFTSSFLWLVPLIRSHEKELFIILACCINRKGDEKISFFGYNWMQSCLHRCSSSWCQLKSKTRILTKNILFIFETV